MSDNDEAPSEIEELLLVCARQLRQMTQGLEEAIERVEAGDSGPDLDIGKTVNRLRDWLRATLELEAKVNDEQSRQHGAAGHYALDLDRARDEIRGRFDRLMRAGDDRAVPE